MQLENKKVKLSDMLESLRADEKLETQAKADGLELMLRLSNTDFRSKKNAKLLKSCFFFQEELDHMARDLTTR